VCVCVMVCVCEGWDCVYPHNKTNSSDMTDTPHYYSHLFTYNQITFPFPAPPPHFPLLSPPPPPIRFSIPHPLALGDKRNNEEENNAVTSSLKVLTNEKRGGLKVAAFDRSPFKLFSLRFSAGSVQAPSCERPKTTQRTLFLSFESNNCFPITV
jgi:hypothetical protein